MRLGIVNLTWIGFVLISCGTPFPVIKSDLANFDQQKAYDAALNVLSLQNMSIQVSDKPSLIQTEWYEYEKNILVGMNFFMKISFSTTPAGYVLSVKFSNTDKYNRRQESGEVCQNYCESAKSILDKIKSEIDQKLR